MMSFCKKSVHSFLAFSNSNHNGRPNGNSPRRRSRNIPSPAEGLTLFTVPGGDIQRPNNVVESAIVKSPPSSTTSAAVVETKKDPGGIGFIDDVGGSVDGLMSCTESLGFESSDERRVDDRIEISETNEVCSRKKREKTIAKRQVKKFPPPLSSLNQNGKPNFFLRPVRKDGRLELKEVKIQRPEILRASRQDGRLRLHLICHEDADIEDQEEEIEKDEPEVGEKIEEEKNERNERWWFPAKSSSGDGFQRCHELVVGHHHNSHVWNQHCVTIR